MEKSRTQFSEDSSPCTRSLLLGLLLRIHEVQAILTNVLSSVHRIKIRDSRPISNSERPLSSTPVRVHYLELLTVSLYNNYVNEYTYLLTPWCRVLLEKLTGLKPVKKFPAFHGTRSFITALTSVRHLSLSWSSPIQSIYPHPTSWRSVLILSTHLRLGLPSGLLPSGFPTKTLYTPSPHPYAPHAQPILRKVWLVLGS